jgi:membrane protease YdiL (CAAX protease family)
LNSHKFFFNDAGSLRAIWRVLLFFLVSLVCWFLATIFLDPVFTLLFRFGGVEPTSDDTWIGAAAMVAATLFMVWVVDKRSLNEIWFGEKAARPALLVEGFLIGAAAIAVPIVLLIGVHWLSRAPGDAPTSWLSAAVRLSVYLLPAALTEELITRGYLFSELRRAWGWKTTLIVTSVAFGLLHLQNSGANVASITLVTLAGLFLGGVLVATRSVYAAWMAHFAWNWTMAVLFHAAVSGISMETPGYRYVDAGPDWATGGVWGPEGGIPAGVGMGAGAGVAYLLSRRRQRAHVRSVETRG